MTTPTINFLKKLLDTPGPSGFESAPARVWRDEVKGFADDVKADVHGNSVASLNGKGKPRVMLTGHIDEIGFQITHIDDDGYLYFSGIGGWDRQVLVAQRVLLLSRSGMVRGVIGKKAIHQLKKEDLERVTKVSDLWIDIGARNHDEAGGGGRGTARGGWGAPAGATPASSIAGSRNIRTDASCPGASTIASARTWRRKRCGGSRRRARHTRRSSRWRRRARRSPGPGAAHARARSASSPTSPWSWTSRTPPIIRAPRRNTRAITSSAPAWCCRGVLPSVPSCSTCSRSARRKRRSPTRCRLRRATPGPTRTRSTTRCAQFRPGS